MLVRGKTSIRIGISNSSHTLRLAFRKRAEEGHMILVTKCHAEQDALRFSRPGDILYIYRWTKTGILKDSRPCPGCMSLLKRHGIRSIYYFKNNQLLKEAL